MGPKRFTHRDRQRLERAGDHYLRACYRQRTAARASELAAFLGVTPPYLSRIVSAILGVTARDFLRRRQLAYAAERLRTTRLSIHELALASAFGTASTFHRCFVSVYGITPGAYRRQVTKCESAESRPSPSRRSSAGSGG
jgi:AraC-like DNA-binding protein